MVLKITRTERVSNEKVRIPEDKRNKGPRVRQSGGLERNGTSVIERKIEEKPGRLCQSYMLANIGVRFFKDLKEVAIWIGTNGWKFHYFTNPIYGLFKTKTMGARLRVVLIEYIIIVIVLFMFTVIFDVSIIR